MLRFEYISRPDEEGLIKAIDLLKLTGGLEYESEKISNIGQLLIKIPIEPFLARAIAEAMMFERVLQRRPDCLRHLPQS